MKNQVRLNMGPEKVWKKVWEALARSQVKFNRVAGEGSGEDSGHLGGFGAEPGQIQQSVYLRPLNSRKAT